MGLLICFLVGTFIGSLMATLVCMWKYRSKVVGRIQFYDIEPNEDPIMTAELYESARDICNRERVLFDVSHK